MIFGGSAIAIGPDSITTIGVGYGIATSVKLKDGPSPAPVTCAQSSPLQLICLFLCLPHNPARVIMVVVYTVVCGTVTVSVGSSYSVVTTVFVVLKTLCQSRTIHLEDGSYVYEVTGSAVTVLSSIPNRELQYGIESCDQY